MTIEEYIKKNGEYGGRLKEFYEREGSFNALSADSEKKLDLINKNYIKSFENKEVRDENINLNISYLADFYLSLFKDKKGESVLKKQIIIDPDEIRKLLAPWGYDKTNAHEFNHIGRKVTNKVFADVLEQSESLGIKSVVFITGAPASGKSSALKNEAIAEKLNLDSYAVVYDSPITDFSIFSKNLSEPLLNKGIEICYIQVYNDPVTTFKNMLQRGVTEGRFLPCLYFLNGLLAQKDRVTAIASEFYGSSGFTYIGINNSENNAKEELCDLKEAEKAFDYNITLSQINKMLAYGENYRKRLQEERERIESTGQTRGTRQDVRGNRVEDVTSTTRNNEDTITSILRGLFHVKVALRLQLRNSLLYNAGTMENPMVGLEQERIRGVGDGFAVTDEVINPKAIKDELIRSVSAGIKDTDLIERAKLIFLGEELATNQIQKDMDRIQNPEKYLPPHYKAMLETNIDDENKFQQGEFAKSERVFTLKKWDYVMGSTNISGPGQVAEMFQHLESFGVENTFAVFIPKGEDGESKAIVQYLASGDHSSSLINSDAVIQGAIKCDAKDVYFIHNHPSGNVEPSSQDILVYSQLSKGLSYHGINLKEGVIINTNTGKYGIFTSSASDVLNKTTSEKLQSYSILEFSKTIFSKDYKPEEDYMILSSRHVAEFLSRLRFGEGNKIGYLIFNKQMNIIGNFFLKESDITSSNKVKIAREISENAVRYSGRGAIIYGRFDMNPSIKMRNEIRDASAKTVELLDIITFSSYDSKLYNNYRSFLDEGLLEDNSIKYNAMNKEESVNEVDNKEQQKESDVQDKMKVLAEQKRNFEIKITTFELGIEYFETQLELKPDSFVNQFSLEDTAFQLNNLKKELQDHVRENEDNKEHVESINQLISKVDSMLLELSQYTKNNEKLKFEGIKEENKVTSIKDKTMTLPKQIFLGYCQTTELKNRNGEKLTLTLPKLRLQLDLSLVDKNRNEINVTKSSNGDEYLNLAVIRNNSKKKESNSEYIVISKRDGLEADVCGKKVKFKDINSVIEFSISLNDLKDKIQKAGINDTKIPLNIGSFSGPTRIKINNNSESVTNKHLSNDEYSIRGNFNVVNLFDRIIKTKQNLDASSQYISYVNKNLGSGISLLCGNDKENILLTLSLKDIKKLPEADMFGNIRIAVAKKTKDEEYIKRNRLTLDNTGHLLNQQNQRVPSMLVVADPITYKNGQMYENISKIITLNKEELMQLPTYSKGKEKHIAIKIDNDTGKVELNDYVYRRENNEEFKKYLDNKNCITVLTAQILNCNEKINQQIIARWVKEHLNDINIEKTQNSITQYEFIDKIKNEIKEKKSEKTDQLNLFTQEISKEQEQIQRKGQKL